MSQKNETPVLILSLLITLALLAAGFWWFSSRFGEMLPSSLGSKSGSSSANSSLSLSDRLSQGTQTLIAGASLQKQAGVEAIAAGNFDQAVQNLKASLQANRNDPEALIYLNNALTGNQKSYQIAVAVPIGSDANGALEMLRGIAQAQDEVNQAGGINGVRLRVAIANDDDNPEIASQIAKALVDDTEVLGVVGHYSSGVTLAAADVYKAGKLLAISPVSTAVKLSGYSPYAFRTVPSDYVAARALANHMLGTLQQQKAAVFYNSQSTYSQSIKSEFVTALSLAGGQATHEFDLSSSGFSAADSVAQAKQQGATVLALLPNTGTLDRALQVVALNRGQLKLLAGDDVYSPKTLEIGAAQSAGMVVAVPWHILSDPQALFVRQSRQLWGADVNWRTAMSYDAAIALITGLKRSPTRPGLQQALSAPGFSAVGATGTVQFLPSGDRNQAAQLVTIQAGSRSGLGFDFVPIQ